MRFELGWMDFRPGDFVVYCNGGDLHVGPVEVGVVKKVCEDGCFVAYHAGDTVAKTPYWCLLKVSNGHVMPALVERARQLGAEMWGLSEGCEDWSDR